MNTSKTTAFGLIIVALCLFSAQNAPAAVITVDDDGPADFNNIQAAIDAVNIGDEIVIADGVYIGEGNSNIAISGNGFTIRSANGPDNCIIDGERLHTGIRLSEEISSPMVIEGITIQNCGNSAIVTHCQKIAIKNCIFRKNRGEFGGAINIEAPPSQDIKLINCQFLNNNAEYGGAIHAYSFHMYECRNCTFIGNSAEDWCGAIDNHNAWGLYNNCLFYNNSARVAGAVSGNQGLYFYNCSIINNHAEIFGGVHMGTWGRDLTMNNCILWENTDNSTDPLSVLLAQISLERPNTASDSNVNYCLIQGLSKSPGYFGGVSNFDMDPRISFDGHLYPYSPCVNAGDPARDYTGQTDIDGLPRVQGSRVDIGCDEIGDGKVVFDLKPQDFRFTFWGHEKPKSLTLSVIDVYGNSPSTWQIKEDCKWLEIVPSEGDFQSSGNIVMTVDVDGMDYGQYVCDFEVTSPDSPTIVQQTKVFLEILRPTIELSTKKIDMYGEFTVYGPTPDPYTFTIRNSSDNGELHWKVAGDANWLDVSPSSGISTGESDEVTITIDPSKLPDNTSSSRAHLTITDPNASNNPLEILVTSYHRVASLDIVKSPKPFYCYPDHIIPPSQTVTIRNDYPGLVEWQVDSHDNWIKVSPLSGVSDYYGQQMTVSLDPTGMPLGTHQGSIRISDIRGIARNSPLDIPIRLVVRGPGIATDKTKLDFKAIPNAPEVITDTIKIWNPAPGTLNWQLSNDCNWVDVWPTSGTSSGIDDVNELAIRVDVNGLGEGSYNCQLRITDPNAYNSPYIVSIDLSIKKPQIKLDRSWLEFYANLGVPTPEVKSFNIWNSHAGNVEWEITTDCNWINIQPDSGISSGPADVNKAIVSIDVTQLTPGRHYCTLEVSDPNAGNSPQFLTVDTYIRPPKMYVNESNIDVAHFADRPQVSIATFDIVSWRGRVGWHVAEDCNWIEVEPGSGTVFPGDTNEVTLSIDSTELASGEHSYIVEVVDANATYSPWPVTVNLYVGYELHVPADFNTIQAAVDASRDGDIVVVADGVYTGIGNRDIDFKGKMIKVKSENGPDDCIIDCQGLGRGFVLQSGEDPNSTIEGLTITNGDIDIRESGGGIKLYCSSCKIRNCKIVGNRAGSYGGGIYIRINAGDGALIENCQISNNSSDRSGGGIFSIGNTMIVNCLLSENESLGGGGIRTSNAYVKNCTIVDNFATNAGGGIIVSEGKLINSIIWGNNAPEYPQVSSMSDPEFNSNCVEGWDNGSFGNIWADPCFVRSGYWGDVSDANVVVEPGDPNAVWVAGDYHLKLGSPCIDAGDTLALWADEGDADGDGNTVEPIPFDLAGRRRVVDGDMDGDFAVDMGAYEFYRRIEVPMNITPKLLNARSNGKWVKAHLTMPDEIPFEQIDVNSPVMLEPLGIESNYVEAFVNDAGVVEVLAGYDRMALAGASDMEPGELTAQGTLISGNCFFGSSTVRLINRRMDILQALTYHWLRGDCKNPDWCDDVDIDQDGKVNFVDYVLIDSICVELESQ